MVKINKNPRLLIIVFILTITFIILNTIGYLDFFKNFISDTMLSSFGSSQNNSVETKNFFSTISSAKKIVQQNQKRNELELKVESLKQKNRELTQENTQLREQLELLPKEDFKLQTAQIIGQDPNNKEELLLINKGSLHGIEKGDPVIISDRILVGEVYETSSSGSKIILSVSPLISYDAKIVDKEIVTVAQGKFNLEILLKLIPNHAQINAGELVITAGKNKQYPAGLIIGEISNMENSSDGLFKEAKVKPYYSINDLKFVSVIIGR
ncbi:MAG: rod shape-determining protein MreC [Candidatus Moranbacteria bacterium]|nr:rod shape-determining protein MreC [Candidatus Moranbacteria bacterium]